MKKILIGMTIAAAGAFAMPAQATEFLGKSNIDFFYAELEGGYAVFSGGSDTAPGPLSLEPDGGAYGTFLLGHVSIDDGIIGGYVDRAELWVTFADQGDDAVSTYTTERDYWEVGTRFQHYYDQNAMNKMMWGFEPFIGKFDGTFTSGMGPIPYDADIYGAMLSFESEHYYTPSTMFHFRAAVGAYGGSSSASGVPDDNFGGFRGQLAAGVTQQVTDRLKVGAVARLDYFSDIPSLTAPSALTTDGQLGAYFGVNLNYIFAGIYE
ncbi:MAG: hypothetical protein KDJ55_04110 [Rhodobiaceae bacterium]|nr:hypothetical protein [Rhodobiaceae bacterium]MCC0018934.1 hypothetical protein [Rhodobiaceae bacterium]MCC0060028.1 hypothetical protein [Rhodobiaceae bacterium]